MSVQTTIAGFGPTYYLTLGEAAAATVAADASGNGHAGTASNITFGVADSDVGDAGKGATAATATGNITVAASSATAIGTGAFTWTGLVRVVTSITGTQVLTGSQAFPVAQSWWIGISGNKLTWDFGNASVGTHATGTGGPALNDGAEHLLAVRRAATGGAVTLLVDGVADSAGAGTFTTAIGSATAGTGVLNFDNSSSQNFGAVGAVVKHAALFVGTALTDAQVNAIRTADTTAATAAIPVTDPNWTHTPFNTFGNGGGTFAANNVPSGSTVAATLCEGGTPASVTVANTANLTLMLDMSRLATVGLAANKWPVVSFSVDGGPWADLQLVAGQTAYQIVNGGAVGTHTLQYRFKAAYSPSANDGASKWTPTGSPAVPPFAVVVTGLVADAGAATVAQAAATSVDLFRGDSESEGLRQAGGTDAVASNDAANWTNAVAAAYGSAFGQLGYGGAGYEATGTGGVPPYPQSSGLYFAGVSRLDAGGHYQPVPSRVWLMLGTNGTTTQADVAAAIAAERSRAPSARVNVCVPPGGFARAAIAAAVAACGDANVKLLDAGAAFQVGLTAFVTGGTAKSFDGLHLNYTAGAAYAAALVAAAGGAATPTPTPTPTITNTSTGSNVLTATDLANIAAEVATITNAGKTGVATPAGMTYV